MDMLFGYVNRIEFTCYLWRQMLTLPTAEPPPPPAPRAHRGTSICGICVGLSLMNIIIALSAAEHINYETIRFDKCLLLPHLTANSLFWQTFHSTTFQFQIVYFHHDKKKYFTKYVGTWQAIN